MTDGMIEDKRTNQEPIPGNLEKVLNSKQMATLREIQHLGWTLKFVRRPLFQDAVPVVYSAKSDQVGTLDPDGNISMEVEIKVRSEESRQEQQSQAAAWIEKRKNITPVPEDFDKFLNLNQMHALRQIETFGWELQFVRRPLFQEPVTGVISPDGSKMAIIERDGRINLMPASDVRKDDSAEQTDPTSPGAFSGGSSCGLSKRKLTS